MKVAAIVPAYNEAERLSCVMDALQEAKLIDEIIVVNDGSSDNTSDVASSYPGVYCLNLPENKGKGGAMYAGACSTDAEIILFLDADLVGMTGEKIDTITRPVLEGRTEMCIGVFRSGRKVTDLAQIITPYISGQRALLKKYFLDIPGVDTARSGVEVAITQYFRRNGIKMSTVVITGCTHYMKEEKLGYVKGFAARMKMYYDIGKITLDPRGLDGKRDGVVGGLIKFARKRDSQ